MKKRESICYGLCLTFLMTLVFGVGWAFAVGMVGETWRGIKRDVLRLPARTRWVDKRIQGVLADGDPFILVQDYAAQLQARFFTFDGVPLDQSNDPLQHFQEVPLQPTIGMNTMRSHWQDPFRWMYERGTPALTDPHDANHKWGFHAHDEKPNAYYLIQADLRANRIVGYLDRTGGRSEIPNVEDCFEKPEGIDTELSVVVFRSGEKIIVIDLSSRSVTTVGEQSVLEWGVLRLGEHRGQRIMLLEKDSIRMVGPSGKALHTYPLGGESCELYQIQDGRLFAKITDNYKIERTEEGQLESKLETLFHLDEEGRSAKLGEYQAEWKSGSPATNIPGWVHAIDSVIDKTKDGFLYPEPALAMLEYSAIIHHLTSPYFSEIGYLNTVKWRFERCPYGLPISLAFGLLAAYFCLRRQRRYEARWTKTWVAVVFLLGPPAYFAWRLHRSWPPLEMVGVTADDFQIPASNGLEVFA